MRMEKMLEERKIRTITEKELREVIGGPYEDAVEIIRALVDNNRIQPVFSSRTNGRNPALFNKYRIVREDKDYSDILEEIRLLHPLFDHQAYLDQPELYVRSRKEISDLSMFLWRKMASLDQPMSLNERSLRIWGKEKYLRSIQSSFANIFRFREWSMKDLNCYETPEPFFEYIHENREDMEILIIENKDTWYTLRRIMKEKAGNLILGKRIDVLLYGEGRKITRGSERLEEYGREMMGGGNNRFWYFGDLDYEGIAIYEDLKSCNKEVEIGLFVELYRLMLRESPGMDLPETRDRREKRNEILAFLSNFPADEGERITGILEQGRYIPQEILNYQVFSDLVKGK